MHCEMQARGGPGKLHPKTATWKTGTRRAVMKPCADYSS